MVCGFFGRAKRTEKESGEQREAIFPREKNVAFPRNTDLYRSIEISVSNCGQQRNQGVGVSPMWLVTGVLSMASQLVWYGRSVEACHRCGGTVGG
jgi:hypothetical protein